MTTSWHPDLFETHPPAPEKEKPAAPIDEAAESAPPQITGEPPATGEESANEPAEEETEEFTAREDGEIEDESEEEEEIDEDSDGEDHPTLTEIHEEIAASSTESRRTARRLLDAMKQIGGVLDAVSSTLGEIHRSTREREPARQSGDATRPLLLGLIELADRIERIRPSLSEEPPSTGTWWPGASKSISEWRTDRTRITDAISIFDTHLRGMLQQAGLEKISAQGSPFDPSCMTAVEAVPDASKPDHTVVGETLPGWRVAKTGEVLRSAQVRVSRLP